MLFTCKWFNELLFSRLDVNALPYMPVLGPSNKDMMKKTVDEWEYNYLLE